MVGRAIELRRRMALVAAAVAAFAAMFAVAVPAQAESSAPGWEAQTLTYPSRFAPGTEDYILLQILNVGGKASSGQVTVTDTLPEGMTATEAGYGYAPFSDKWECTVGAVVTCTNKAAHLKEVEPGQMEMLVIAVRAPAKPAGPGTNEVTVSGGGASAPSHSVETLDYGSGEQRFGYAHADVWFSGRDGAMDTQAGSHPYTLTTDLEWDNTGLHPAGEVRDVTVNLPKGLVGNPTAVGRCTEAELNAETCPVDSQVGTDYPALGGNYLMTKPEGERNPIGKTFSAFLVPSISVYNMVPPPGHPAQLGFLLTGTGSHINTDVRTGGDYGLNASIENIPQVLLTFNTLVIWGDPAEESHNWARLVRPENGYNTFGNPSQHAKVPFLTLPTACEGPLEFTTNTTEWPEEGIEAPISEVDLLNHTNTGRPIGMIGCDRLKFGPKITAATDTSESDTPAGLTVEVNAPQEGLTDPEGLAAANIKDTTVTLPEGLVINPGQAQGLVACSQAQSAVGTEGEPTCPNASQVGTDEIETPLLFHSLKGRVYVLKSNPPNLKLLVQASGEGVHLKLVGDVHLDEATGRVTATFNETPELPFSTFRLSFSGGARAALATPTRCGTYTTTSDFTPWATPSVLDAHPTSRFVVNSGAGGSPCATGTLPFKPELTAGSTTDQAGGYTGFSLMLKRGNDQQRIERLQFKAPPGLSGMLASVPLCEEPQASAGTCSATSQIGHSVVSSGPGPYPLVIPQPGGPESPIYLTGPYDGAPFGLSIVTHVIAGPFNLGTIVTRGKIEVDPHTAQITVTTDPLPQVIDGVPTNLRMVDAVIDRKGFMFNPTSCAPMSFSGTAWGAVPPGAGGPSSTATIASRFQVGSCRGLPFEPKLSALTKAHHTRKEGAYFHVVVKSKFGDADIKEVHVELPKALPSELKTLQHACTEQQFASDPAGCPKESFVGHATIHTPVLPVALRGPAIFVSHGGAKFPELVLVLQGDGVTIELNGETFISKAGVTSSTFKSVPDQPFNRFDLVLPQKEYSALGATTNFCKNPQKMPTRIVGQNGAVVEHETPIMVGKCGTVIAIRHKHVHGSKATILLHTSGAGKLTANGKGIAKVTKRVRKKGGRVGITVHLKAHLRKMLRHGHRHHVKVHVHLTFKAKHGKGHAKAEVTVKLK